MLTRERMMMNLRTRMLLLISIAILLATTDRPLPVAQAESAPPRIQFRVTTIEESRSPDHSVTRQILSDATIEGPAGTDFNINLQGGRFRMQARFLTDLLSPTALRVRAQLDTRRLYGYSERDLPLYEEDNQRQRLDLSFDEQLVLLPFGRRDADEKIKIEITPSRSPQAPRLADGRLRPLEINILKQAPGGEISIEANLTPHRFAVETLLLENGVVIARSLDDALLEETADITLQPLAQAASPATQQPLVVSLTLEKFTRSRPADFVAIRFDAHERLAAAPDTLYPIAQRWAGVATPGSELLYDISKTYLPDNGKTYELRFKIKLAKPELLE